MAKQLQIQQTTYFREQYDRYEDHLHRKGIKTPVDYLDHYNELDGLDQDDRDFIEALDTPLDALYSIHPFLGQNIMYVDFNPGTKRDITISFGGSNEYSRKAAAMEEKTGEERLIALMWHMGSHYGIKDQPGREYTVKGIYNHFSCCNQFDSYLSYKNRDVAGTAFEDIYFSRMYKWPSSRGEQLEDRDLQFGKKEFLKELDIIEPNLLIMACKEAWDAIRTEFSEQIDIYDAGSSSGGITGNYGRRAESDIGGIYQIEDTALVTLPHPAPQSWNTSPITGSDVDELFAKTRRLVDDL